MTNTEKYLDSIDGPEGDDLIDPALLLDTEDEDEDTDADDSAYEDDYLDFDSNYEDDRYGTSRNGMPSWSLFA